MKKSLKKNLKTKIKSDAVVLFQDETKVHPALKEYFGYCLFKASAWLRSLHNEALQKYNIQSHHLGVLKILEINGPTSQIQLGDELGIDKASMVKIIDHLEKNKYVERNTDKKDRRIKNVKLTHLGSKLMKNCSLVKEGVERNFFSKLTPEEQNCFRNIISRVLPS